MGSDKTAVKTLHSQVTHSLMKPVDFVSVSVFLTVTQGVWLDS